ncbi:STAS domain-containing protein [Metabacillus iocasae]|uniref:RsbT co-antagonist protein RsbR n=1 Tax=Priestia iocasae TaxID=2291674 RepID=A0ABS2QVT1_9BACI|nr:STAS domain-containing protein [Metabacillus iocasae]MBM7703102.1 rsbT co-antagonist protein RsbR [Metabacillus iocasae]
MKTETDQFYDYLLTKCDTMLEGWLQAREIKPHSVYSANAPIETENQLIDSTRILIQAICKMFNDDQHGFEQGIKAWTDKVAERRAAHQTPIYEIIQQFYNLRTSFWNVIKQYVVDHQSQASTSDVLKWSDMMNRSFDYVITQFTEEYYKLNKELLTAQQEMINELSSPIIPITAEIGVLPLIGDIDTNRAKYILESTLKQCEERKISHLFIDLSGVPIVDTMVAHQIFQVVETLRLLGVETTLSGIRPEVAQTAVNLGLDFVDIPTQSNLAKALASIGLEIKVQA